MTGILWCMFQQKHRTFNVADKLKYIKTKRSDQAICMKHQQCCYSWMPTRDFQVLQQHVDVKRKNRPGILKGVTTGSCSNLCWHAEWVYIYISCKAAGIQYAYLSVCVCVSKCLWMSVCRRSRVSSEGSLPYCSPLSRPWPLSETQHAIKRSTKELLWGMSLPLSLTLYKSPWTTRRPGMLLVENTMPLCQLARSKDTSSTQPTGALRNSAEV